MEKKRVHLNISGRVQGVFFRYHTQETASRLGLSGWVKNTYDGGVEVTAEGPEARLQELIKWCRQGPPSARVTDVKVVWDDAKGEFDSFKIKYS